jgi:TusA-related sulfurtransferase
MTLQYTYDSKGRKLGVFIPINEWKKIAKKYKELDEAATENPPAKQDILNSIKEGLEQVKLHQQGKVKLKTAQQLLDEL